MKQSVHQIVYRLYQIHVERGRQTYHEFCRTVAMNLGWPTQRVYSLVDELFPDREDYGEGSIYENMHRYGF